ncbi:endonuclease/exonuclease/phosphatase family protein [Streptomyces sp. NPDC050095]|uniref:endonuclease/exonuclease/phosphatase family protein n=1 Tax=unclassified Streptomyces TaxID=2593676 RepID=UPI00342C2F18
MRIANLNAYKLSPRDRGTPSWDARVSAIQEIAPDILALQEIVVDHRTVSPDAWDHVAAALIHDLADACHLSARIPASAGYPHGTAMAANRHRPWWTALLWNPATVQLAEGSYRPYGAPDFWHGCTTGMFDIGAHQPLKVASYHGDPIRPNFRRDEALRLKSIFRTTGGVVPGVCCGDFNAISAALIADVEEPSGQRYYDPEPYVEMHHDDLEYQLLEGTIGTTQLADRRQTEALLRNGYMVDAAAHLQAPWQPTVGHWKDGDGDPDPWGQRRIDLILATQPVAPALTDYRTHRTAAAERAADHLPVYIDLQPHLIAHTA